MGTVQKNAGPLLLGERARWATLTKTKPHPSWRGYSPPIQQWPGEGAWESKAAQLLHSPTPTTRRTQAETCESGMPQGWGLPTWKPGPSHTLISYEWPHNLWEGCSCDPPAPTALLGRGGEQVLRFTDEETRAGAPTMAPAAPPAVEPQMSCT